MATPTTLSRSVALRADARSLSESEPTELTLEPKRVIAGKYVLEQPAGFGGMAELWVATNMSTGAEVCIKVLVRKHADEAVDDESVERFRREAYAAARLSHRAIVRVFDLVELDVRGDVSANEKPHALAIVMELLRGETLGDVLCKRGRLPLDEALDVFLPIVSALAYAHRANVVHRDVKPDNIFLAVDPDGHVTPKVLDFGISKLQTPDATPITEGGVLLGTPSFMSPEQAKGAYRIDARSDVFSAGIVFYMTLTGTNPFDQGAFADIVRAILDRPVPPIPGLPPAVWSVLDKALAKDANQRYADATELGIALRRAAGRRAMSEPGIALRDPFDSAVYSVAPSGSASSSSSSPPALFSHVRPAAGKRRRSLVIVATVLGAAIVIGVLALLSRGGDPKAGAGEPAGPGASKIARDPGF